MKRMLAVLLVWMLTLLTVGCAPKAGPQYDVAEMSWDEVLEASRGTTVTLYGWGGSDMTNGWLDNEAAAVLKQQYGITLNRVPMNIDEILAKMVSEKQAGTTGTVDVVWINGENFYTAKENGLLHGPFTGQLPNFNSYVDGASPDVALDFGYPTQGFEAPYGKAQFVLIGDPEKTGPLPTDHQALLALAKANPGRLPRISPAVLSCATSFMIS